MIDAAGAISSIPVGSEVAAHYITTVRIDACISRFRPRNDLQSFRLLIQSCVVGTASVD
jgi:hypothetical protein